MKNGKRFHCNVELTIDVIGGKWKPMIMHHIGENKVIRYGELKRKIPNINQRVLTRQLKELESSKLISKKVYEVNPPKVEYSMTELGESLVPLLIELGKWGHEYNKSTGYGEIDLLEE